MSADRPAWLADASLANLASALTGRGVELLVAGGAVRDTLLGGTWPDDIDAVAGCAPSEGFAHLDVLGITYERHPYRSDSAFVRLRGGSIDDSSLTFVGHGRSALDRDAAGRDFTCNAIYLTMSGDVIDPVGGVRDIADRVLRSASPGSFIRDPVRLVRHPRMLRILADAREEDGMRDAMRAATGGLAGCPPLRIVRELAKCLDMTDAVTASRDVAILASTGTLSAIYPEADAGRFAAYCALCEERGLEEASEGFPRLAVLGLLPGGGYDGRVARWGDSRDDRLERYARFAQSGPYAGENPIAMAISAHGSQIGVGKARERAGDT